nr:MAG TPA: hypothetical protein [Caudoviricetes sp.]
MRIPDSTLILPRHYRLTIPASAPATAALAAGADLHRALINTVLGHLAGKFNEPDIRLPEDAIKAEITQDGLKAELDVRKRPNSEILIVAHDDTPLGIWRTNSRGFPIAGHFRNTPIGIDLLSGLDAYIATPIE